MDNRTAQGSVEIRTGIERRRIVAVEYETED